MIQSHKSSNHKNPVVFSSKTQEELSDTSVVSEYFHSHLFASNIEGDKYQL